METKKNSKEVIYKMHNIKTCFKNAIHIIPKRNSDDINNKAKVQLFLKNNISNVETIGATEDFKDPFQIKKNESSKIISKEKKENNICIKFKDLIVESEKNEEGESHMELALRIKKKRKTNIPKCKNNNNNICLDIHKTKEEEIHFKLNKKKHNSTNKVILGCPEEENIIIKTIKKKFFCC